MSGIVYRVVDVCAYSSEDMCYLYLRDRAGTRRVVKMPCVYQLVLGSKSSRVGPDGIMSDVLYKYKDVIRVEWLGVCMTYHRGTKSLLKILCKDYATYDRLCSYVKYNADGVFRCGAYSTVEDVTMMSNGLYGALYVHIDTGCMRAATAEEEFPYTMSVAGFDLEMSNLDPVDPDSDLYMAAYCGTKGTCTIIYSSSYLATDVRDTAQHTYIRVSSRAEVALELAKAIAVDAPDVLVGYNIYHADVPALYHALRKTLSDWPSEATGPLPYYHYTKKLEKKYINSESGLNVKIPGTHTLDMYSHVLAMIPGRNSYTLDDVSRDYLGDSKKPMGYKELMRIYRSGNETDKIRVMEYCAHDAALPTKLYTKLGAGNYYASNYSLTGVDPQRTMAHGKVSTTYGICYKRACAINMYMDDPNAAISPPSGGLVLSSAQGMYQDVDCVDIASLYPNIVIHHNIDSCTILPKWEADEAMQQGLKPEYYYSVCVSNPDIHVLRTKHGGDRLVHKGASSTILPTVLRTLLSDRLRLKRDMATCTDPVQKAVLAGKELAAKMAANSACGAFGEQTPGNPISHCELNDLITTAGRSILSLARNVAQEMDIDVLYGDTDSLFIHSRGRTQEYIAAVHEKLPENIRFKLEYTASKFIAGTKKHYVYLVGDEITVKGYKAAKSSKCAAAGKLFMWLLDILMKHGPDATQYAYQCALESYCSDPHVDVKQLAHSYNYRGKDYADKSHMKRLLVAMRSRGIDVVPGNTRYLVTVHTYERYVLKYGKEPSIALPPESSYKGERLYDIDEVSADASLVDIRTILDSQCYSDLSAILSVVRGSTQS